MSDRKKEVETQVKKMIADFQEQNADTSIRVFVSWTSGGLSAAYSHGGGDYYSQYGCISQWVEGQKAQTWAEEQESGDEEKAL